MSKRLCGLDIGTSGCKAVVYDASGEFLGRFYQEYPVLRTHSAHEIDAYHIRDAVMSVLKEAAKKFPQIAAMGITSFGETFVLLDENDQPLCYAILYTDTRGADECEELCVKVGKDRIAQITGLNPHSMYSLPKLMWIKKNSPEVFSKAKRIFLISDYIVFLLTGNTKTEWSLASRTMAFDITKLEYSDEILAAAGIDKGLFPSIAPTGMAVGAIKHNIMCEIGLSGETIVCLCGHDQVAAAVGAGVFDVGGAVDGAGTVECITPVFESPNIAALSNGNYAVVPFLEPGKYISYAFTFTGGALVKWFAGTLAGYSATKAKSKNITLFAELEDEIASEPTGLLVLPHFAGAATPYMDSGSKGIFAGLTLATSEHDIHFGIMEGICYELLLNLELLYDGGIKIEKLRATGGGANSKVWNQMKADIWGIPVTALNTAEAGTTGCAIFAGIAADVYKNLREAADILVKESDSYFPRDEAHKKYLKVYRRYKKLYQAVRPLLSCEEDGEDESLEF
jgi:xylulokinase